MVKQKHIIYIFPVIMLFVLVPIFFHDWEISPHKTIDEPEVLSVIYDKNAIMVELNANVKNLTDWNRIVVDGGQLSVFDVEVDNRIVKLTLGGSNNVVPQRLHIPGNTILTEAGHVNEITLSIKNSGKYFVEKTADIPIITYSVETPPDEFSYATNAVRHGIESWEAMNRDKIILMETTSNPSIKVIWKYHKDSVMKSCTDCASKGVISIGFYHVDCGNRYVLFDNSTLTEAGAFGMGKVLGIGGGDFDLTVPVKYMPTHNDAYKKNIAVMTNAKNGFDLAMDKLRFNVVEAGGSIEELLSGEWEYPEYLQADVDDANGAYMQYATLVDDTNLLALRMSSPAKILNCPSVN